MLTENAVRTQRSLLPPKKTDTTSKSSSPKALLGNGQIPEFSNPAKVFFMMNESGCSEAIMYQFFPRRLAIIQSFCTAAYFALKGPITQHHEAAGNVFSAVEKRHRIFCQK
jgi:hypothetical protein